MGMNLKKWKPFFYILTAWITLKLIAFVFGFTPWPDIAQLALMGGTYPIIVAASFALWIGASSHDNFTLPRAVRNAVIAAVVIGSVELLLTVILLNNSPSFVTYVTAMYPLESNMDVPFLNLVISTWVGGIFLSIPTSATAYLLMGRNKKR
jgi:apolipoprotein N-acyltransferase